MSRVGRLKTFVAAAGAMAVLLAASPGHAEEKQTSEALEVRGEAIFIWGEGIPDQCEEAWGPSYEEVLDSEYNLAGCACKFGHDCGEGDGFGWNPEEPTPPDNGGGTGSRDDDCEVDDAQCNCQAAEEEQAEEAPEVCELSCAECGAENSQCLDDLSTSRQQCENHNEKKAQFLCQDNLEGYATVDDCVYASLNGFPGIGTSDTNGSSSGWGVTVKGAIGRLGNSVGLDVGYHWEDMKRRKRSVSYPPVPVDRTVFPDCRRSASTAYEECSDGLLVCNDSVEDSFGESCEQPGVPREAGPPIRFQGPRSTANTSAR